MNYDTPSIGKIPTNEINPLLMGNILQEQVRCRNYYNHVITELAVNS